MIRSRMVIEDPLWDRDGDGDVGSYTYIAWNSTLPNLAPFADTMLVAGVVERHGGQVSSFICASIPRVVGTIRTATPAEVASVGRHSLAYYGGRKFKVDGIGCRKLARCMLVRLLLDALDRTNETCHHGGCVLYSGAAVVTWRTM